MCILNEENKTAVIFAFKSIAKSINCNKIGARIYVTIIQCFDRPLMSLKVVTFSMSMLRSTNWPSVMTDPTSKFTKKMEMRG